MQLIVTCEHASDHVPKAYAPWFDSEEAQVALGSHRGLDIGAGHIARAIADAFEVPYFQGKATRLLVELNRSLRHPNLWSAFTKAMPLDDKERVLAEWYRPYREAVASAIQEAIKSTGPVFHLSVHSFTPVLNGEVRNAEIGLLYDPSRKRERALAKAWKAAIHDEGPELRVRMNYPYRGIADGFTTYLRKQLPDAKYAGIELEINQGLLRSLDDCANVRATMQRSLATLLEQEPPVTRLRKT